MLQLWWCLSAAQFVALVVLLARLAPGRTRLAPVSPGSPDVAEPSVTVIVAALNEARRIGPCLGGLSRQGPLVREILVVDSNSTDGTRALVEDAASRDPRIRLLTDPPLPPGWVGKVWALQYGLAQATSEWFEGGPHSAVPSSSTNWFGCAWRLRGDELETLSQSSVIARLIGIAAAVGQALFRVGRTLR